MRTATLPKKFLAGLLTFFLVLSPFQFNISPFYFFSSDLYAGTPDDYGINGDAILIEQDTTWTKDQDLSFNKRVFIVNGATLTITEGAEVILGNEDVDSPEGFLGVSDGSLRVIGTEKSPVVFRGRDHVSFYINFDSFGSSGRQGSFLRYAVIGEGGDEADNGSGQTGSLPEWLIDRAYAAGNGFSTVNYFSGKVRIENTQFSNEQHLSINIRNAATEADFPGDFLGITNSNFANKQDTLAVQSAFDCPFDTVCQNKVVLKNDWFGASTGPKGLPDQNPVGITGDGSVVDGPVVLDGFRKKMLISDPVIIVPGIMGSAQVLGVWKLDPILHSYDDLIASLETNGYEADTNLFEFPYDWRRDNGTSAHYLQGMVEDVLESTSVSQVDIVAHSMGGLVARAYIEEVDGALYDDTVDQLVTLGTPNDGSPEAYLKWEAGEGFFRLDGILAKHHFEQEAEEAGYEDNLKGYIQERVTSVKQLLPDYSYLADISDAVYEYPSNYPQNAFLEELNSDQNKNELAAINYTNIVGLANPEKTISRIRVQESEVVGQWEHGMPENFYNTNTDQGLEYGSGDETVPERSAKGVGVDTVIEVASTHGDLPTKAQCDVFRTLTGKTECSYDENIHIPNILLFNVFSPIDIQIIAPDGSRVGKNFATGKTYSEIPGAYYTGYDTKNEFITIPNPEKGEYRILMQGTDTGTYRVEVSHIQEDENGTASESTATITGTTELTQEAESSVEIQTTGEVVLKNQDITPPVTTIALSGTQGTNDWYTSDVTVTLTAQDETNGTGIEKIEYSLDNGTSWNIYIDPLVLSNEGTTMIQYFSTDKQGNKEETQTKTIKIDKTAPEAKVVFNPDTQKLEIIGIDTLGESVSVVNIESVIRDETKPVSQEHHWYDRFDWNQKNREKENDKEKKGITTTLTDQSGHTMVIVFEEKENEKNHLKYILQSLSYDGVSEEVKDASMQYEWQEDWRGRYMKIDAQLRIPTMSLESHYSQKKNETWITKELRESENEDRENDTEKHETKERITGMIVPGFLTKSGTMNIVY